LSQAVQDIPRRAILVDARGHGESDKPHEPSRYAHGAMAKDAAGLLDHLGVHEVDVVGYSMGSLVAIGLALADPRVRSLFLGGVGLRQVLAGERGNAESIADALEAEDKSKISGRTALAFRNFADSTRADRRALAAAWRARSGIASRDIFASLTLPTLVVNGENDTLIGPLDSLADAIPAAKLVKVPGDHLSAVVKPEFRSALVGFLSTRGVPT